MRRVLATDALQYRSPGAAGTRTRVHLTFAFPCPQPGVYDPFGKREYPSFYLLKILQMAVCHAIILGILIINQLCNLRYTPIVCFGSY